jgi:hypothetical protein
VQEGRKLGLFRYRWALPRYFYPFPIHHATFFRDVFIVYIRLLRVLRGWLSTVNTWFLSPYMHLCNLCNNRWLCLL